MSLLGELTYFLGLQVQQTKEGIFISQTKYFKYILNKYRMEDSKPICTPMVIGCSLSSNNESLAINQPTYRSMIGSLLYLIGTRPDIMHAIRIWKVPRKSKGIASPGSQNNFQISSRNSGLWTMVS